jgi:hypothetical protein
MAASPQVEAVPDRSTGDSPQVDAIPEVATGAWTRMDGMRERYESAPAFREFLERVHDKRDLWHEIHARARVPADVLERARRLEGRWRFLVLTEDWCGDGLNTLPFLARLVEAVPGLEMRLLSRDANPDLMDAHLTEGTRSIPVVIVLDEEYREVGWWGPRPAPLQEYFLREIKPLPKQERFPRLRAWYARDRGRTTLAEILDHIPPGT